MSNDDPVFTESLPESELREFITGGSLRLDFSHENALPERSDFGQKIECTNEMSLTLTGKAARHKGCNSHWWMWEEGDGSAGCMYARTTALGASQSFFQSSIVFGPANPGIHNSMVTPEISSMNGSQPDTSLLW